MKFGFFLFNLLIFNIVFISGQTYGEKSINEIENLGGVYGGGIIRNFLLTKNLNSFNEKIYISSVYDTFEITSINLSTKKKSSYKSSLSSETQAFALVEGTDNNIYIGTSPNGHLMRIDEAQNKIVDLGKALVGEEYIWSLVSYKNKIFGSTYPNAKLFSYDLKSNKVEDLGKMDEEEMYAKSLVSDGKGNIYVGLGYKNAKIKKYNIKTRRSENISLEENQINGIAPLLSLGLDNNIYVEIGNIYGILLNDKFINVTKSVFNANTGVRYKDNQKIGISKTFNKLEIFSNELNLGNDVVSEIETEGKLQLFRLGLGPNEEIYASTALPLYLVKYNEDINKFNKIDWLGNGEAYSFANYEHKFFLFCYSSLAEIMLYNSENPINRSYDSSGNPYLILSDLVDGDWRPFDAIETQGKIFIGSMNGYGKEGGALVVFNPNTEKVENKYNVIDGQSITALCKLDDGNLAGGTFVQGGYGTSSVFNEAKIFIWDTKNNKKLFESDYLKGFKKIDALISQGNKIYGISSSQFFVYDIKSKKMIVNKPHFLGNVVYNGIIKTKDNKIYGVAENAIFTIDIEKNAIIKIGSSSDKLVGGIVEKRGFIYMISKNNDLLRFKIN